MEKKISADHSHRDGLMMVAQQIGQAPRNKADELLTGDRAVDLIVEGLKEIMGYSGVTVEEARETLNGKKGPHLGEVLAALNKIEEENNPSTGSGFR